MPRIFDNMTPPHLVAALQQTLATSTHADYCVGYFNLRGWGTVDSYVNSWAGGTDKQCRLLIGMQRLSEDDLRLALAVDGPARMDQAQAARIRKDAAASFRRQLSFGVPDNVAEGVLRRLARQLRAKKLVVKLHARHTLHAKLYLHHRADTVAPIVAYLGSSNLTLAGLVHQGELNVDVVDDDAARKLQDWFDGRWDDNFSIDISEELATIIEESWARPDPIPPYHIFLKMAYALSQEDIIAGRTSEVPGDVAEGLLNFQLPAVQRAVRLLRAQHGVVIGDVVGLGKTLMATAVARTLQDSGESGGAIIICPKNLERMWNDYRIRYGLHAEVVPSSTAIKRLDELRKYGQRLVVVDESHNFRNREGKTYQAVREWIHSRDGFTVLLSATPYNTGFLDLGAQLGLFLDPGDDIEVRPEAYIRQLGGSEQFHARHEAGITTLAAFEHSRAVDDWRDIMARYMVRRTRSFIMATYAQTDTDGRKYLEYSTGKAFYFPTRVPKKVTFTADPEDPKDQYGRLFAESVQASIRALKLPRYGLGAYLSPASPLVPTNEENRIIDDLGRAGERLIGFCRVGLFKRLESAGPAFIQSVERHILRNFVHLDAIDNGLPLPVGTQDATFLDESVYDEDQDRGIDDPAGDPDPGAAESDPAVAAYRRSEADFRERAGVVYESYRSASRARYRWIRPGLFGPALKETLEGDCRTLLTVLQSCGTWMPDEDAKLAALINLVGTTHSGEKVLIFSQFADTVRYLRYEMARRGVEGVEGVIGGSADPTLVAYRFSPRSNDREPSDDDIRVLVATDVLSEGQNLQDAHIIVNYDLPWALVRLIQRAGRVDRIGQQHPEVLCYSFLPADGIETIINLRSRVLRRLHEQGEVLGSDEQFFEDRVEVTIRDLYTEKSGIFDPKDDPDDVDLVSLALSAWSKAIAADPSLEGAIKALPDAVYSARAWEGAPGRPPGTLAFLRTGRAQPALLWLDGEGTVVSQSAVEVFRAAECAVDTPPVERSPAHHEAVRKAVEIVTRQGIGTIGVQLGRKSAVRYRVYTRLKPYLASGAAAELSRELALALDDIAAQPLRPVARDILNRDLRTRSLSV